MQRELVAKFCEEELFTSERAINRLAQTDRNLFQKIYDWIRDTVRKLDGENSFLVDAERMYKKALESVGEVQGDETEQYVMNQSEQDTVKEQLRERQEELNRKEAVATISDNGRRGMSTGTFRKKIVDDLKKTGYRVENQKIGTIEFDEKLLNRSLNYIQTDAEAAAYQALPQVLKRGIEISGHGDHKDRGYETLTIAAPVILNGKRGNMAAVVMKTKGNRYKVHRILTPEGETFELPKMANAESTSAGGITEAAKATGAVTPTIDSASKNSITGADEKSNRQFSYGGSLFSDSEGRELSKQQAEYFRNSKVLDEDGNLRVVYHVTGVASLASALDTEDGIIPVRMTVKFYDDKAPKLHIVINGATSITAGRTQKAPVSAGSNSATIRIADFLDIVKDSEEFTKRIPMDQITGTDTSGETAEAPNTEPDGTSAYKAMQLPAVQNTETEQAAPMTAEDLCPPCPHLCAVPAFSEA